MIVVDVGCHPQGPEESVHVLVERFKPEILFGFDPYPDLVEGVERVGETVVVRRRVAAWTRSGTTRLVVDGICTGVDEREETASTVEVPCIDLPEFLFALPTFDPLAPRVILKLDAEGAEYPLLERIHRLGLDARLALVLVEWHPPETAHGLYADQPDLRCPVEAWG